MSPPSAWPRELVVEARRTLLAMPVALNDAVSAGDFPGMLLDSREGIYVASFLVAALVPFVRRLFVDLVAEVREKGKGGERTRKKMMRSTPRSIPCLNINLSLFLPRSLHPPPSPPHQPSAKRFLPGYKPQRGIATRQSKLSKWKGGSFFGGATLLSVEGQTEGTRGKLFFLPSLSSLSLSLFPFPLSRADSSKISLVSLSLFLSHTESNQKTESAWKLFVYFTLTALAAASTAPFGFFLHTPDFWKGCTAFPPCNYQITRPMGLAYALELGEF